jgi:hypothetical protein
MGLSIYLFLQSVLLGFIVLNVLKSGYMTHLHLCKNLFQVQFLQDIGVRSDAIGNVLVKFPPVLTYSLYKKIRPMVCSLILLYYFSVSLNIDSICLDFYYINFYSALFH